MFTTVNGNLRVRQAANQRRCKRRLTERSTVNGKINQFFELDLLAYCCECLVSVHFDRSN